MTKAILTRRNGYEPRKFVSPSYATDHTIESKGFNWKDALGLAAGAWAVRRFPVKAIVGLVAVGVAIGFALKKENGSSTENLH